MRKLTVGTTWLSGWVNQPYTGPAYYTQGGFRVELTMPPDTGAFYFYTNVNDFGTATVTATDNCNTQI